MKPRKNALEWSVFGCSLALIAVVTGVLAYDHFTTRDGPPVITIALGQPAASGDGFVVPVDVRNEGDQTAEDVQIEVMLSAAGPEERGGAVITLLPRGSHRRAWVGFRQDPAAGTLTTRVIGYRQP